MNILMIFQHAPLPPPLGMSSAKRNYPFFEEVSKRHTVSVLSYGTPGEESTFRQHFGSVCRRIRFVDTRRPRAVNLLRRIWFLVSRKSLFYIMFSAKMQKEINAAVESEQFDLIHCCMPMLGLHKFPAHIPRVTDTHNVEYDLLFRHMKGTKNLVLKLYYWLSIKSSKRVEIESLKKFDVVLATTETDRLLLASVLPGKNIKVISNGVDSIFFEPSTVKKKSKTMIFVGSLSYYPNHHAVLYFLNEIFPLIQSKAEGSHLTIVGPYPGSDIKRRASEHVTVTGFVDDVRPYVAGSEVFIIPIHIGGGIRGKALEAMAMQIPIVTTTIGCEGIHLVHRESALFADTPEEFANRVVELFDTPALSKRLTDKAYKTVVEEYNWASKGQALEEVYQSLAGKRDKQGKTL